MTSYLFISVQIYYCVIVVIVVVVVDSGNL